MKMTPLHYGAAQCPRARALCILDAPVLETDRRSIGSSEMLKRSIGSQIGRTIMSSSTGSGKKLAFGEGHFDSASYADFRPSYGKPLYDQLFAYHRGRTALAIDIGCGTGQITSVLADHFDRVRGFDTSAKMLDSATRRDNITYATGGAESLPILKDGEVDLVTVGQATHWFDTDAWFREMHRVLRPGGTLSFWSYNEMLFTHSDVASQIWSRCSHDDDKLGPHWPQPGRKILEDAMDAVQVPQDTYEDVERHYTAQRGSTEPSPVAKQITLTAVGKYMRTSSAYHNWRTKNASSQTADRKAEDVIDRCLAEVKEATGWTEDTVVDVHWPTIAVLARRRV